VEHRRILIVADDRAIQRLRASLAAIVKDRAAERIDIDQGDIVRLIKHLIGIRDSQKMDR
jgi:hypothetical protein